MLSDRIIDACHDAGFHPDVADEAFPAASVILLVVAGVGVSMVPALMSKHLCHQGVVYRSLVDPPMLGLSMVWRVEDASPAVSAFVSLTRTTSCGLT